MSCLIIHEDEQGRELAQFWVEQEVLRIGSNPQCQVAVDGLPAHAATLRFHQGVYELRNRSDRALLLDGTEVPPNGALEWPAQSTLRYGNVLLRLRVVNGDPRPAPAPRFHEGWNDYDEHVDEYAETNHDDAEAFQQDHLNGHDDGGEFEDDSAIKPPKNLKNIIQLTITGLCIVGVIVLLAMKDKTQAPQQRAAAIEFPELISKLMESEGEKPWLEPVRIRLQDARRLQSAGRTTEAREVYVEVRDQLLARGVQQPPAGQPDDDDVASQALSYALQQIAILFR